MQFSLLKGAVTIHAAYGSSRDIQIFTSLGLTKDQIFIIGKQQKQKEGVNFQVTIVILNMSVTFLPQLNHGVASFFSHSDSNFFSELC